MQVRDGSREYEVNGRVETMVRWLVKNEPRISRPSKVQVTFDCAGQQVSAEVKQREQIRRG